MIVWFRIDVHALYVVECVEGYEVFWDVGGMKFWDSVEV
jgi:hypothetical protein